MTSRLSVVLLTTETTHHTYFAWKLSEHFPLRAILLETGAARPPFETAHPFERLRDDYERQTLLAGGPARCADVAATLAFPSLNQTDAVTALAPLQPHVLIVFGTGHLHTPVIRLPALACLNLHGGNPEQYRGLDTHLWAIYHRDFANLVTTLHHVDETLDTGDIVVQSQLRVPKGARLHELRASNARTCVEITTVALTALDRTGDVPSRKQTTRGRYYSAMPTALKEDCVVKFERWTGAR